MRALLGCAVFLFPILSSSAASPPVSPAPQEPIRIGVSWIGQPVRMVHRRTYEEMDGLLERGEVKIAFICSATYVKDGERRVMGDSTMEVIRMYRNEGLSGSVDTRELPDHVGVGLEFMSYLVFKEIKALETSDLRGADEAVEKQERFSGEFLRRWIPPFCERIKENTENGFYAALAQCASTFIGSSRPAELCDVARGEKLIASR
jgi:hypothetical protein